MFNSEKLQYEMWRRKSEKPKLAASLRITESSLNKQLQKPANIKIGRFIQICDFLGTDPVNYFSKEEK